MTGISFYGYGLTGDFRTEEVEPGELPGREKMRTKKVMDINLDGFHIVCVRMSSGHNPFRVYRVSGGHRRQVAKYGDFMSVVWFVLELYRDGADTLTLNGLVNWAKEKGAIW